jgi:hypothetical protein
MQNRPQPGAAVDGPPMVAVLHEAGVPAQEALAGRFLDALRRRGVQVSADSTGANCVLVLGNVPMAPKASGAVLLCCYGAPVRDRAAVLAPAGPAALAVLAKPEMSEREALLFFPELFAELHTHCQASIPAAMLRFCFAKAVRFAPGKAEVWA